MVCELFLGSSIKQFSDALLECNCRSIWAALGDGV